MLLLLPFFSLTHTHTHTHHYYFELLLRVCCNMENKLLTAFGFMYFLLCNLPNPQCILSRKKVAVLPFITGETEAQSSNNLICATAL